MFIGLLLGTLWREGWDGTVDLGKEELEHEREGISLLTYQRKLGYGHTSVVVVVTYFVGLALLLPYWHFFIFPPASRASWVGVGGRGRSGVAKAACASNEAKAEQATDRTTIPAPRG